MNNEKIKTISKLFHSISFYTHDGRPCVRLGEHSGFRGYFGHNYEVF